MKPYQTILRTSDDTVRLIYDHTANRLTRHVPLLGVSVDLDPRRWWQHMQLTRKALQACNIPLTIHQIWRDHTNLHGDKP